MTPDERFLANTEPLVWSNCVVWTASDNGAGYGRMRVGARLVLAHRYAWERANGPIPNGVMVDHICHLRSCVNIEHLRLATNIENQRNRAGANAGRKYALPRGVYATRGGRYQARATVGGKRRNLGTFPTIEQASDAAANARAVMFGIYAGGR